MGTRGPNPTAEKRREVWAQLAGWLDGAINGDDGWLLEGSEFDRARRNRAAKQVLARVRKLAASPDTTAGERARGR